MTTSELGQVALQMLPACLVVGDVQAALEPASTQHCLSLEGHRSFSLDGDANVYFVGDYEILRVNGQYGGIEVLAGTWKPRLSGDGGPASVTRPSISGITVDKDGSVWFTDGKSRRIRVLERSIPGQRVDSIRGACGFSASATSIPTAATACTPAPCLSRSDGCHSRASRTCCPSAPPPAPSYSGRSADPLACRSSGGASTARA